MLMGGWVIPPPPPWVKDTRLRHGFLKNKMAFTSILSRIKSMSNKFIPLYRSCGKSVLCYVDDEYNVYICEDGIWRSWK